MSLLRSLGTICLAQNQAFSTPYFVTQGIYCDKKRRFAKLVFFPAWFSIW
jgi:hypothetical protein